MAWWMGTSRNRARAGTMKTPPPRPTMEPKAPPTKPTTANRIACVMLSRLSQPSGAPCARGRRALEYAVRR